MPQFQAAMRSYEKQQVIESFYRKYKTVLKNYFVRRVRSHAEADDLTQELLIRVTQQVDRNEIENPDAFVFTVAGNLLRNKAREWQRGNRKAEQLEYLARMVESVSPERILSQRETLNLLMQHLELLNTRAREVFFLHRLEGMKYSEIALHYGISVSTVEKDMIKAIAHISRCSEHFRD